MMMTLLRELISIQNSSYGHFDCGKYHLDADNTESTLLHIFRASAEFFRADFSI